MIPLEKHLPSNFEEKEESDQNAIYEQLEKLGYNYFIEESYVTHFIILPEFPIHWSISLWIDYWFNELAVQHHDAAVDAQYRFVCTSLDGSEEASKFYSKKEAKVAYEDYYRRLGYPAKSINSDNSIPIDIDVEEFEQAITAELSPEPDRRWVHNFYTPGQKCFPIWVLARSSASLFNHVSVPPCSERTVRFRNIKYIQKKISNAVAFE